MAVKATRVVKYIRKGDTGDKGDQGAVLRGPQAWSDCATGYAFKSGAAGEKWLDVVIYNNNYYVCKSSHAKTSSNYPGSSAGDSLWQLGDQIDLVATKIMLATYALIENLGASAIQMKDSNGNIIFEAKDGAVTCKLGTFTNINVQSGQIAGFKISGNGLTNDPFSNDAYVIFRNDTYSTFAGIGGNVLPASTGAKAVARFENYDNTDEWGLGANYALLLGARNSLTNIAAQINGGCISGLAVRTGAMSASGTISRGVHSIVCTNTSEITITLPTMELYDDGYVIKIKNLNGGKVNIRPGYSYHGTVSSKTLYASYIHSDRGDHHTYSDPDDLEAQGDATEYIFHRDVNNGTQYGCWVQYKHPRDW